MRTADIIDAVLDKDIPVVRAAFEYLISSPNATSDKPQVKSVLLSEVCFALAADHGAMEEHVCAVLGLPANSPFRKGAAKVVA